METLIVNAIRSLDKNARQEFAKIIRTDPNIWNGINGIGDIPKDLPKGKFQGFVKNQKTLLDSATIIAKQGDQNIETKTNGEGFYSIDLAPGTYDLVFIKEGFYETIIAKQAIISENTITINIEMTKI